MTWIQGGDLCPVRIRPVADRGCHCQPHLSLSSSLRAATAGVCATAVEGPGEEEEGEKEEEEKRSSSGLEPSAADADTLVFPPSSGGNAFSRRLPALIEAADQGLSSRTEVQNARCGIVDMLRGAMDDAVVAEEICTMLNGVMAKSLLTLKMVSTMLRMVATTDLTRDVARLRRHDFERVCALAPSIVRGGRRGFGDRRADGMGLSNHEMSLKDDYCSKMKLQYPASRAPSATPYA
uniref:Uncharacterized protein n=1 Tax=Oryza rufipogon TaxID=4529 RepID=A0A0E0Q6P6_ORYRU